MKDKSLNQEAMVLGLLKKEIDDDYFHVWGAVNNVWSGICLMHKTFIQYEFFTERHY